MTKRKMAFLFFAVAFIFAFSFAPSSAFAKKKLGISSSTKTTVSSGTIYSKPDTGSKVVGKVKKGKKVSILSTSGGFVKIRTSRGKVGYVKKSVLGLSGSSGLSSSGRSSDRRKDQSSNMKKKDSGTKKKNEKPSAGLTKTKKEREKAGLKKKKDSTSPTTGSMKEKEKGKLKRKASVPLLCLAGKAGIATPFSEVMTAAVEGDIWYRLLYLGKAGLYATGAVGYIPLKPYIPLQSDDPEIEGYWVPIHAGLNLAWFGDQLQPYVGAAIGGHSYNAKLDPDKTRLDLDDEDDTGNLHELDSFGFGGRLLGGIGFKAGPGSFLLEGQLIGAMVEQNFATTFVFYLGYRFCMN